MSRHRNRWRAGGVAGLIAAAVAGATVPAEARTPSSAAANGCEHYQAYVAGDDAAVAARLPDAYEVVRDRGSDAPVLFVRAVRCAEVTIGDRTQPTTFASFGVVVESPDGRGCFNGVPVVGPHLGDQPPACNWYALSWQANEQHLVRWLRDGAQGFPSEYAPNLRYTAEPFDVSQGGAPFSFEAPPGAPSPFRIAAVGRERPGEIAIRGGYWRDTQDGTVKLAFSTDDITSGDARGTVTAPPGSELAVLMGATERPFLPSYGNFAAERWRHAAYRKQIVTPSDRADRFDGSCSLQGDVKFRPPASNTAGPLEYTYDARGTCTGTLNGRDVADAPVTAHTAGRSYGSCSRAQTTAPGSGTISFPDGTAIRFTLDFTSIATEIDATWYGERSGTASARGTFLTPRTTPEVLSQCRTTGVSQIPMDVSMTTQTPLASDRRAGGPERGHRRDTAGSTRASASPRLRLTVAPRRVRVGRRTAFVFRVRTAAGRPVARALVRFASRRARTDAKGAARIVTAVRRTGRGTVRATRPGFRAARAFVRIR